MMIFLTICSAWLLSLVVVCTWKYSLFNETWNEFYFAETPVLIESDDWGPGEEFHAQRLLQLLACLAAHKDSVDRAALLTADIVLSVPDIEKIMADPDAGYHRKLLNEVSPEIYQAILFGIKQGVLVPQLHGLEHLNGQAFARLCQLNDSRIADALVNSQSWDWEDLASALQGHYVDGSELPTQAISSEQARALIVLATQRFTELFGFTSFSTVAPCYLWNSDIERLWQQEGVSVIQTAGYRCDRRDKSGHYHQDRSLIRAGDLSESAQVYLVRNVMYEPVDGNNNADTAYHEARVAYAQALPISISTHRYNYTRTEGEFNNSIKGLDQLLKAISSNIGGIRYLSSPELGQQYLSDHSEIVNHFNNSQWKPLKRRSGLRKLAPYLWRLYYRHPKLVVLAYISGLIIPASLICRYSR